MLFIMALVLTALTSVAQEKADSIETEHSRIIPLNRTFSVGGNALTCQRSQSFNESDIKSFIWTLENNCIGDHNFLTFECKERDNGNLVAYKNWYGDVECFMAIKSDGTKSYIILDETFIHLQITELKDDMYMILFYSDLIKK